MADLLFSLSSLLFLAWVVQLKREAEALHQELRDLRERIAREMRRAPTQPRRPTQSAIWKGPALS